jgi:hypothetical protein
VPPKELDLPLDGFIKRCSTLIDIEMSAAAATELCPACSLGDGQRRLDRSLRVLLGNDQQ